ncbi:hypothetical protein [Magnetospirillum moscoviense]|uniref:Uncharacterized protein n=1 Tax=Magnetospirillum moscoviense TaxID=1437059 RepID=A0A178MLG4_9PROT|nr:hypothetical protein [Magnetospirillum moscoviense]OAN48958.1 hypothetical protein A6A05_02950 [Magnetospirillum moscoviense]
MWRLAVIAALVAAWPAWAGEVGSSNRQIAVTLERFDKDVRPEPLREAEMMLAEDARSRQPDRMRAATIDLILINNDWGEGSRFLEDRRLHR